MGGATVGLLVLLLPALVKGHRMPCKQCESYVEDNDVSPHRLTDEDCGRGCSCGRECSMGVGRDWCGCCQSCGQAGHPCGPAAPCDPNKPLVCRPHSHTTTTPHTETTFGICREVKGLPCTVYNQTYENGETFTLDCRTQCTCQDGRYACASLCPKENIAPLGNSCRHPRLVEVPGQCCREWMCDSGSAPRPPECTSDSSAWSECSSGCGAGLSRRVSNNNPQCTPRNETRLCQLRPCPGPLLQTTTPGTPNTPRHHIRRGHECKATRRLGSPARLRFASCLSKKEYRPRWCGACGGGSACLPELSTTLMVAVTCRQPEDTVEDATQGQDLWWTGASAPSPARGYTMTTLTVAVQWVLKCRCRPHPTATPSPELVHLHRVHRTAAP